MGTAVFDSLNYFGKLKNAAFIEDQVRAQANAMREIVEERLATKKDIEELEKRLDERLVNELQKLELRMTTKLGAMLASAIAIVAALVKLL